MPAAPVRTLLALALPMVLARASQSVITFADVIQVHHLGAGAIAATATGGLNTFAFIILPMGLAFIIQSFVAQLVGRGQRDQIGRFAWYGLGLALLSGVIAVAATPAVRPLLGLTGYSPGVRNEMADYIAIRLLSVAAVVGVEALGNWYGGAGNTWMQMIAGAITMTVGVFCNWMFIDGHLGAPALGVRGAAVACVIASWAGFAFIFIAFLRRPDARPRGLRWRELRRVLRFGLPNGLNWFLEFAAFQLFVNGVLAGIGDTAVAAVNAVIAVNSIAFMPAFGLASAGAILAGQAIGRRTHDDVWPQVKITLAVSGAWMGAIGIIDVAIPRRVLELFGDRGSELVETGVGMLVVSSLWQLFDAVGLTLSETLRAAGDTTWTAGARLVIAWTVFVPGAYAAVHWLGWGPVGAMLCLVAYLALLAAALSWRFRSGTWRTIELIEPTIE